MMSFRPEVISTVNMISLEYDNNSRYQHFINRSLEFLSLFNIKFGKLKNVETKKNQISHNFAFFKMLSYYRLRERSPT